MKKCLIIDGYNMFMRGYIVVPSISTTTGEHIGGIVGMLKMLQTSVALFKPDEIFVVWDGSGGNKKRREINENYKLGRKPPKLNRFNKYENIQDEETNRYWQQSRTIEYLNIFPIIQLCEDGVEADDIISYLVWNFPNSKKVIISSDKDFCQLASANTMVYRPITQEVMTKDSVLEKFQIHPNNLALARAIEGDISDNLIGVKGVGLKTITKKFPFFKEANSYNIEYLVNYCNEKLEEHKVYQTILDNINIIKENYSLMQLYSPNIYQNAVESIQAVLTDNIVAFNKKEFFKMSTIDGLFGLNLMKLFSHFENMEIKNK